MPKNKNQKERINLNDSVVDAAVELADGNPGAISVIMQLIADKNDPDGFAGGLGNLLSLDAHGIYGSNIWVLFKNVCGQSILNMVIVLRAVQLGLYSERDLWICIDNCTPLDCQKLLAEVRKELPRFGNAQPA